MPLYDTLGVEAVKYIMNQTEMATVVGSIEKVFFLWNRYLAILILVFKSDKIETIDPTSKVSHLYGYHYG